MADSKSRIRCAPQPTGFSDAAGILGRILPFLSNAPVAIPANYFFPVGARRCSSWNQFITRTISVAGSSTGCHCGRILALLPAAFYKPARLRVWLLRHSRRSPTGGLRCRFTESLWQFLLAFTTLAATASQLPRRRLEPGQPRTALAADAPRVTPGGRRSPFPPGRSIVTGKNLVILEPPEPDSHIAIVDVDAADATGSSHSRMGRLQARLQATDQAGYSAPAARRLGRAPGL